jgi:hypothetical protein
MMAGATKRTVTEVGAARGPIARPMFAEVESRARMLGRLKRELAIWQWRRSVPSADLGSTRIRKD